MIAFAAQFDPDRDHADFSANAIGLIGDSQDRRFSYIRTDGSSKGRPEYIIEIDWGRLPWLSMISGAWAGVAP